jgi:hypothetical protein
MENIVIRRNRQFIIDSSKLKPEANRTDVINGLYAAIYDEFKGASKNKVYMKLTPLELIKKLNEFAYKWLKDRGFN